jgi:hypothetical protein
MSKRVSHIVFIKEPIQFFGTQFECSVELTKIPLVKSLQGTNSPRPLPLVEGDSIAID